MAINALTYFVALILSFFLFYFNVPYWTGRDMADMSDSGIWRAFFRFLSFLGYGIHKVYAFLANSVMAWFAHKVFRGKENKLFWGFLGLLHVLLSMGLLYLLTAGYTGLMNGLFPAGVDALAEESGGGILGWLGKAVAFIRVAASFRVPASGWSFSLVIACSITTLAALLLYVVINTVFFSILFGLLRESLEEVRPLDALMKKIRPVPLAEQALTPSDEDVPPPEEGGSRLLLRQLTDATWDFFNKMTIMSVLYDWITLVLFLLVLLAFSFIMTMLGKDSLSPLDVVKQVLDSIGVVQIIASFIVTYLVGKAGEKTSRAAIKLLPEGMQNAIHTASRRGNDWADREDAKRNIWSREHSAQPKASPSPAYAPPAPPKTPVRQEPIGKPKTDRGQTDYNDAVELVLETVRGISPADAVSEAELLRLLDAGGMPHLAEWQKQRTYEEKAAFLRKYTPELAAYVIQRNK